MDRMMLYDILYALASRAGRDSPSLEDVVRLPVRPSCAAWPARAFPSYGLRFRWQGSPGSTCMWRPGTIA